MSNFGMHCPFFIFLFKCILSKFWCVIQRESQLPHQEKKTWVYKTLRGKHPSVPLHKFSRSWHLMCQQNSTSKKRQSQENLWNTDDNNKDTGSTLKNVLSALIQHPRIWRYITYSVPFFCYFSNFISDIIILWNTFHL